LTPPFVPLEIAFMMGIRTHNCFAPAAGLVGLVCAALPAAAQTYVARVNNTDRFAVVLSQSGQGSPLNLRLTPLGVDECGRTFYLSGVLTPNASRTGGTFSGTMVRCTNKELKDKCAALGRPIGENYNKPATGTFRNESFGLILNVTYQAEKWLKNECKFEKSDTGDDAILITDTSAATGGGGGRVTYDNLVRSILYSPPGHPLHPR
jgi:hypothetical protein